MMGLWEWVRALDQNSLFITWRILDDVKKKKRSHPMNFILSPQKKKKEKRTGKKVVLEREST